MRKSLYESSASRPEESSAGRTASVIAVSDIEVLDLAGFALDEVLARLDSLAHQHRENGVCLGRVFDLGPQQGPRLRVHRGVPELVGVHLAEALEALNGDVLGGQFLDYGVAFGLGLGVVRHLTRADAEERRLGDEEVAVLDDLRHVSEEEGQEQSSNVGAVHVGIGHDDDPVIPELGQIERVADAGAQGNDQRPEVLARNNPVETSLLDVEKLPSQRQDRLKAAVAALLGRATGGVAFDEVDLALGGIALLAVGQLARQRHAFEGALAYDEVAGLACRLAGAGRRQRLLDHSPAVGRVLVEVLPYALGYGGLDLPLDLGVAELGLGLAFELRLDPLDADDGRQALANVLPGEVRVVVLQDAGPPSVVVERSGQRGPEAGEVRPAVDGVDVVSEAEDILRVCVVVLERDLDRGGVLSPLNIDRAAVEGLLVPVQVTDEGDEPALEIERTFTLSPIVDQPNPEPLIEVSRLAQALGDGVEVELDRLEDLWVGQECSGGALAIALRAEFSDRGGRHAARVLLGPDRAVPGGLDTERDRQGVHDTDADTMEAARHLVAAAAEFGAGVEDRMHDLECVLAAGVATDGHASTVVRHADRAVVEDAGFDVSRVSGHGLVDRVVDDLPNEMVQAADIGRADEHARASANGIEALEDLDALGVVVAGGGLASLATRRRWDCSVDRSVDRSVYGAVRGFLRQETPPVRRSKRRENSSSL